MKRNRNTTDVVEIAGIGLMVLWIGILAVGAVGWVLNILDLAGMSFPGNEIEAILRAIGIVFPPLGAAMGLFA